MDAPDLPPEVRRKALAVAEAVYRLTGLASFDAALKFALRKDAAALIGCAGGMLFFTGDRRAAEREQISALVASLQTMLRFAHSLGFVAGGNAERVLAACSSLLAELAALGLESEPDGPEPFAPNERQEKILAHLAVSGGIKISDIRELFGDACSEKTLQRDLWQLVRAGRLLRAGDNRWTVYSLPPGRTPGV